MATLKLDSVGKMFGPKPVLEDINLDISDGEFVSLVGPSGCGKSTLLRMIAGLETIGSGTISIDGRVVNVVAAKDRDVAMVFQNYALYPHMTVFENMSFALETHGRPKAEITAAVARAAEILGLSDLMDRLPRELSGGQQQRVAMGRAIVRKPKVFLFDEPLSNLDAQLRVQMRSEIKELHAELGATIVYVTHDQLEAMTMSDRVVVLKSGSIEQVGAPLDLYDQPKTEFVATFIGSPSMNLIDGQMTDDSRCTLPDGMSVETGPLRSGRSGNTVRLGIRPEDLVPGESGIPGRVVVVEPSGAETQIVLETDWGARISALVRGRANVGRGDTLHLRADPDRLHAFDVSTGARLN